jgi:hypothetical protein
MLLLELMEAPIDDFNLYGDWSRNSSFRHEQDRKLLQNPKAVQKIKNMWSNTPVSFNIMLVNSPEANRFMEEGAVTIEWLQTNMPKTLAEIELADSSINVIFTNNKGDQRVPMTGWIMAHRLSHAFSRYDFGVMRGSQRQFPDFQEARSYILQTFSMVIRMLYHQNFPELGSSRDDFRITAEQDRLFVNLFHKVGTFKSARDGKIRNEMEFTHECFAQYITTGRVRFNPLPAHIKSGRSHLSLKGSEFDVEYYNQSLTDCAEYLEEQFNQLLHRAVGKILVM